MVSVKISSIFKGLVLLFILSFLVSGVVAENVGEQYLENIEGLIDSGDSDRVTSVDNNTDELNLTADQWYRRGTILASTGNYEEALNAFNNAIEIAPENEEAWNNKGIVLYNLKRYEEEITAYEKAIEINENYTAAWENKVLALYSGSRYEEAVVAADRAIELSPNNTDLWNLKAGALAYLGRPEEAILAFDKAIELNPSDEKYWANKGNLLNILGRHDEALIASDKAIELDANYTQAWIEKGIALYNLNRFEEAIDAYSRVIELNPNNANIWNNKGDALFHLGRFEEALFAFEQAIELDPNNANMWNNKGVTLKKLGRIGEANDAFDTVKQIETKNILRLIPFIGGFVLIVLIFFFSIYPLSKYIEKRKQNKNEKKKAVEREKARILQKIDKFIKKSENEQGKPSEEVEQSGTIREEHPWESEDLDPEFNHILKEARLHKSSKNNDSNVCFDAGIQREGAQAGICPVCGSPLVWRKAKKTGELYRGCINYNRGCRYNDRSY